MQVMEKIVDLGLTPEDHYDVLDAYFTDILSKAGCDVDEEVLPLILAYNRHLRIALGLPVEVPF